MRVMTSMVTLPPPPLCSVAISPLLCVVCCRKGGAELWECGTTVVLAVDAENVAKGEEPHPHPRQLL